MNTVKMDALVVPHTHWDRAWFWPVERFRIRLIQCLKTVLELLEHNPEYRFTLDGQVLPLEDYLEACPQDRRLVAQFVRHGRLKLGPLYCQPDLYCTGGEALIRNLLLGRSVAEEFGGCQRALYMADTFGIIPSLPMIAAGFDIPCFIFMRGMADELPGMTEMSALNTTLARQVPKGTRMFRWQTPDGSEVAVMHLRDGYANAARLGMPAQAAIEWTPDMAAGVQKLIQAAERQNDPQGTPLLLLAGVDHQIPQRELLEMMREATAQSRYRFVISDFDEMANAMAAKPQAHWPTYQGEFHGLGAASVLGGTLTSRIYLKQDNARAERLLTDIAEPATAVAALAGAPDFAAAALPLAWKTLLKAHPHDDICGCSVDAVQVDTESYIRHAGQAAEAISRQMVRRLAEVFGGNRPDDPRYSFLLVNTQVVPRCGRVRIICDFEALRSWGDFQPPPVYALVTEDGHEVPFVELQRDPSVEHPHQRAILELEPGLEPFKYQRFYLEPRTKWPLTTPNQPASVLENTHLRVDVHPNGTFDLTDKQHGVVYPHLGQWSDQADVGDEYDFADFPQEKEELLAASWQVQPVAACSGLQMLKWTGVLKLPRAATPTGRSSERIELPVEMLLSLGPNSRQLECSLKFTNTASDHRLRWNLALPWHPQNSRAGVKFNEVLRPTGTAPLGEKPPRIHPEHPADPFVAVMEGSHGLAVFGEFPFNYELVTGEPTRLAITLLRAVGYLSRADLSTRGGHAGPGTPTPDAQCLGRNFDMRFAIRPHNMEETSQIFFEAMQWRSLPIYGQLWGYFPEKKAGVFEGPFLQAEGNVILSAFKPRETGSGFVLRLFNPTRDAVTTRLLVKGITRLRPVGLHEEPTGEELRRLDDGRFEVSIPPFGLQTFQIMDKQPWKPE